MEKQTGPSNKDQFNQGLLEFIDASPTPWHAVEQMSQALMSAGYRAVKPTDSVEPGEAVFVREGGAIVAATTPQDLDAGWRMVGAHTDSPNLRLKPNGLFLKQGALMGSIETYGGVLMNPWFDRELGIAGRAVVTDINGDRVVRLIDSARPVAVIPSLAIHLDREANKDRSINAEQHLNLLFGHADAVPELDDLLAPWGLRSGDRVMAADLCAYPVQPSDIAGLDGEWIMAPRLDNLLSCYTGLQAILASSNSAAGTVLVCNDHEEIGSQSHSGAQGPLLQRCLEAWGPPLVQAMPMSMMVSADNAHGVHPNYSDRHAVSQQIQVNQGPALKINANQRYASEPETLAIMLGLAEALDIPIQQFANRADLGCGSTIGPISATLLGVRTVDIGAPTFAMHSCRELAGSQDGFWLFQLLVGFLEQAQLELATP